MKNNELISIVIPIYNIEKYVKKCIESVLNQDYLNIDIILVDDGATDNSGKICDEYKNIDSRIQVIHKLNGGLSDARNAGIKVAKGEYIIFIDGDDYIKPNYVSKLYNNLLENDADISVCGFSYVYDDGKERKYNNKEKECTKVFNSQQAIECMLDSRWAFKQCAWNKIYKKELFKDIEYPYGMLYEDLGTTYKLISKANKVVYDSNSLYYYVQRKTSITKSLKYNEREKNRILMANQMCDFLKCNFKKIRNKVEFFRATQYLSVINVMYMEQINDASFIYEAKDVINKNVFNAFAYGNLKQKIQFIVFSLNSNLYKKILLGGKK